MKLSRTSLIKPIYCKYGTFEKKTFILILVICIFVYLYYSFIVEEEPGELSEVKHYLTEVQKYLINTSNCKIPDVDPFNDEVKKYVYKEKYMRCTKLPLLTYIDKSNGSAVLKINNSLLWEYSFFEITCCYSHVLRINYYNKSDNDVSYSPCTDFEEVVLSFPFIKVICRNFYKNVYLNVHATVIPAKRTDAIKVDRGNRFSVLMVGIDSISKLNLRRTMPKTYLYLEKNFHSLKGYNKIGDNTFPNLMAILTGHSYSELRKICDSDTKINDCDMIWDAFRSLGYKTAYAEDESRIATFYYDRPGFRDSPTDYYYHPYSVASEELGRTLRYGMSYCAGPETSGERIFNVAKDFSVSFKDVPSFGLFWMNSFSHDNINLPSSMDEKVLDFLEDDGVRSLSDTIIIFFSDHGFRFGDIRYTHTGWLEERLPFIYIYIPDKFKRKFEEKYENFLVNTERLTTPYDLYNTLQDILEMGNETYKGKISTGCPDCVSLFKKIPENRTCKMAAIDQHWCTCTGHNHVDPSDSAVQQVAQYIVEEINNLIHSFPEGPVCAIYNLNKIVTAGMSEYYLNENNETVRYFLIMLETSPTAMFEATVEARLPNHSNFNLLGDISRINRYKDNSYCVKKAMLKKYCFCDGYFSVTKNAICNVFNC